MRAATLAQGAQRSSIDPPQGCGEEMQMEPSKHRWGHRCGYECCLNCGVVRRADDNNKPCRGVVHVAVRVAVPKNLLP